MSNVLTAWELSQMRADITDVALPDTCDILSLTRTSDGQGGWTEAWGTATAGVACRLDYSSGIERLTGGAIQAFTGWVMTLPYSATITAANRIGHTSGTYNVIDVDRNESWSIAIRARLEKV